MKRQFFALLLVIGAMLVTHPANAQTCVGTSGSASINGVPWTAVCVLAETSSDCVDSLGTSYECFQIAGTGSNQSIAIYLDQAPTQGQTYPLGGTSPNGAVVLSLTDFWVTANAPYTGQVEVTTYSPGTGVIACNFSFEAQSLFAGADISVTNGTFVGQLVPVAQRTWSDVKELYRK